MVNLKIMKEFSLNYCKTWYFFTVLILSLYNINNCIKRIVMNKNNQYLAVRNKWEQYQEAKVTNSLIVHSKKPANTSSQANLHSGVYQNFKDQMFFKNQQLIRHSSQQEFKKYRNKQKSRQDKNLQFCQEYYHKNIGQNNPSRFDPTQQLYQSRFTPYEFQRRRFQKSKEEKVNQKYLTLKQTSSTSSTEQLKGQKSVPTFVKNKKKLTAQNWLRTSNILKKQRFQIIKMLGQGKFGSVFLVKDKVTNFIMAMKSLHKKQILSQNFTEQFIRQVKIQSFLNHPNIIKIYGCFDDEYYIYILMELGSDGQLYDLISQGKVLTEEATSIVTKNLLQAVHLMHSNNILHRDIKPENIVLNLGNVKMCDFGWAANKTKKNQLRNTFCGTPLYLSPQLLNGSGYDQKVDLWAIGVLVFELMMGCSPFQIQQRSDLQRIIHEQVKFPKGIKTSKQFKQFIMCILNKNPSERFSCQQLLKLKFITQYDEFQTCEQLCG